MRKTRFLSALGQIAVMAFILHAYAATNFFSATCTGSDPCNACKNCKYCKHCAKEGGTCGVCKNARRA